MINSSTAGRAIAATPRRGSSAIKQRKFLIGGVLIALAIGYLMYSSLQGSIVYYMTPTEMAKQAETLQGQGVRVGGNVVDGTVSYEAKTMTLKFDIADETTTFPVVYKGVVPDAFKPGVEVVVEGKYQTTGVFEATTLLAKCPSKYVPE